MNPRLAQGWAFKEVDALLAQTGFDAEAIAAQTIIRKLDAIDRIDRSIAKYEARRVAALREKTAAAR